MQKLIITGNVGKDPEERYSGSGSKIVSFSLGASNQDKAKTTTWYECACFNEKQQDIIMTFVKKGSKLLIIGKPSVNAYINKTSGYAVGSLQITVNEFELLGGKSDKEDAPAFNAPALEMEAPPF